MGVEIVTDKYSTAIFELASETNTMDQLETDLAYVGEVFASQPQLRTLLLYPTLDANAKCDTLNKIFGSSISTLALHFLFVMVKRGRARYIGATIKEFIHRVREAKGIVEAQITVSEPMTADVEEMLRKKLESLSGKQYVFETKVDPSIVGGIVIQVGDTRIDASLARRLEDLKKHLLRAGTTEIGVKG